MACEAQTCGEGVHPERTATNRGVDPASEDACRRISSRAPPRRSTNECFAKTVAGTFRDRPQRGVGSVDVTIYFGSFERQGAQLLSPWHMPVEAMTAATWKTLVAGVACEPAVPLADGSSLPPKRGLASGVWTAPLRALPPFSCRTEASSPHSYARHTGAFDNCRTHEWAKGYAKPRPIGGISNGG
jgi:hypothetical protein